MKTKLLLAFAILLNGDFLSAQTSEKPGPIVSPLDLRFQRLAVRRFIFSNNIPLSEFVPSEIVSFVSMHPAFVVSSPEKPVCDTLFRAQISQGQLILNKACGNHPASFYVGGVNPYATYEIEIMAIKPDKKNQTEIGFEFARLGLRDRVQVIVRSSAKEQGVYLRVYKDGIIVNAKPGFRLCCQRVHLN